MSAHDLDAVVCAGRGVIPMLVVSLLQAREAIHRECGPLLLGSSAEQMLV
jgi:hypothetical protein